jgi:hypothetical protein
VRVSRQASRCVQKDLTFGSRHWISAAVTLHDAQSRGRPPLAYVGSGIGASMDLCRLCRGGQWRAGLGRCGRCHGVERTILRQRSLQSCVKIRVRILTSRRRTHYRRVLEGATRAGRQATSAGRRRHQCLSPHLWRSRSIAGLGRGSIRRCLGADPIIRYGPPERPAGRSSMS